MTLLATIPSLIGGPGNGAHGFLGVFDFVNDGLSNSSVSAWSAEETAESAADSNVDRMFEVDTDTWEDME